MRYWFCLLDVHGAGIGEEEFRPYEALPMRRGLEWRWQSAPGAAVLTVWDDPWGDPLVARDGDWLAVGMVRLDNRAEVAGWIADDVATRGLTDLELVLRVVARHGVRYIGQILGDFGLVVWHGLTRWALALTDAFAVKKVYYAERNAGLAIASRAEMLALEDRYDAEYLTRLVTLYSPPAGLTVYAGVKALHPASWVMAQGTRLSVVTYWNPWDVIAKKPRAQPELETIDACRQLLTQSIRLRIGLPGETWAQLSGGLDSSSVVSLAQWLVERGTIPHGLAGTVTYVDRQGTGADERIYSDAVVQRWRLRNYPILDPPTWYDGVHAPPLTDQPTFDWSLHPRDQRLYSIVHPAGGRVLLTGWGGDQLFMGSMLFFADWLVKGRVVPALHDMARRAALGRVSLWELAYRNALLPLLPGPLRNRLVRDRQESPAKPWMRAAAMRKYGIVTQSPFVAEYGGRVGHKYEDALVARLAELPQVSISGLLGNSFDVRHPLLYRPLVEFALALPPELRAKPHAQRWVLRQALTDILPPKVLTRVGKPDTGGALAWSFATAQPWLAQLLRRPILAELDVIDGAALRDSFAAAAYRTGRGNCMHAPLLSTLTVEAWLQVRSGTWPCKASLQ